ncbi:DNA-binding response regulator [Streptacidiphilus pinicola]|uniref:DNA-binding response regulator n=1 Tax=Streptacidiphilus pinicola TaxID=2219663 RepID=A0A2X0ITV1_9ACTN|nr:response regulator [Streptacidiphilus pinicola]RAG87053.1 DNA-binding response regulator [Streptacidiphilus pinicola]
MTQILVVDDEPQMLRALKINLQARKYTVTTAADGAEAIREAARSTPDAILLDLGLPDMDGVKVIQTVRTWSSVPVIVLSGRADATEKVAALDAGADDYVTKPFAMNELLARLRAALRRPTAEGSVGGVSGVIGPWTVDLVSHTIHRTDDEGAEPPTVRLTPTEWKILAVLLQHPGRLVTAGHLLNSVWGPGHESNTNYLRVYFTGLRRKLETDPSRPRHLITEPGMGYRYQP